MRLEELLSVIVNGHKIRVFDYNIGITLYDGGNFEFTEDLMEENKDLSKYNDYKVLYVCVGVEGSANTILIGLGSKI